MCVSTDAGIRAALPIQAHVRTQEGLVKHWLSEQFMKGQISNTRVSVEWEKINFVDCTKSGKRMKM